MHHSVKCSRWRGHVPERSEWCMVDLAGIEPATSRTPSGRSPPELQARPSIRYAHSGRPERRRRATLSAYATSRVVTANLLDTGSWILGLGCKPVVPSIPRSDIQYPSVGRLPDEFGWRPGTGSH